MYTRSENKIFEGTEKESLIPLYSVYDIKVLAPLTLRGFRFFFFFLNVGVIFDSSLVFESPEKPLLLSRVVLDDVKHVPALKQVRESFRNGISLT